MTPSDLFKPYTGMTVEGSTEKERAEIYDLLDEKGLVPINKPGAVSCGFYYEPKLKVFINNYTDAESTNIPYTEFKQLIEKL